jgi:hypothetical protein
MESQIRRKIMEKKSLWISVVSGGVLTTLVSNLPILNLFNCLLCIWFWSSAIFAAWLYRRLSGSLTPGEGLRLGALTGLCAGILGFALSFAGLAGLQGLLNGTQAFLSPEDLQGIQSIPGWGVLLFNMAGVAFNVLFGAVGGWIGGMLFRTDRKPASPGVPV